MAISWEQVLATIINFIILLIILKFVFWGKLKAVIEARERLIVDKVATTEKNLKESEELKLKNKEILKNANLEGSKDCWDEKATSNEKVWWNSKWCKGKSRFY